MSRSEARTGDAWRSFDTWATWIIPLLFAVPAAYGLAIGVGTDPACCSEAAAPAAVAPVIPAPEVAPAPPPVEAPAPAPVATTPTVDCGTITAGATIGFATSSATLTEAGKRALDQVIVCLNDGNYEIAGHTDSVGEPGMNQSLSVTRARSALQYLVSKGVAKDRLTAVGFGETQPLVDNSTPEGRAKNRRLAFRPR